MAATRHFCEGHLPPESFDALAAALLDVAIDASEKPPASFVCLAPSLPSPLNGRSQFPLFETEINTSLGCNGQ